MRMKSFASAVLLALAVTLPTLPAVSASAASTSHSASAHVKSTKAAKAKAAKKAKKAQKALFNLGGRLTAVDAGAGTVTFTVHGGQIKALRGESLTVTLAEGARVLRNDGPATLADFVVGDKVRAKGTRAGDVFSAKRVKAVGVEDEPEATPPPTPEEPTGPEEGPIE